MSMEAAALEKLDAATSPAAGHRKKLLIVEDNLINRQILSNILEDTYEIIEAGNGRDALSVLHRMSEDITAILLDLVMPVMDGYTFLDTVKEHPLYANIPILVTSSSDGEEDELRALSSGATDFIRKPYRPLLVKHRVNSIVSLRENAAMVNLLRYDQVTGVYSRAFFTKYAADLIRRNPEKCYDMICSDIESFNLINDMFSYETGNAVLRDTASILTTFVGPSGLVGRLGADTFAMLVERRETYTEALFTDLNRRISERFPRFRLHLDFGVYHIINPTGSIDTACDRVLTAIESVKGNFTSHFAIYDEAMRQKKRFARSITDHMEGALANREFFLCYQPKYDLKTERIIGAEALVRWNSPRDGFLPPGAFIPLFEKNSFITELDKFVWNEAAACLRRLADLGIPPIPISVNVSRTDLYTPGLPQVLLDIVKRHRLDPALLHLEITESAYTEHPERIIPIVEQLRSLNFIIEMDDFGAGYSSLNMLSEIPIDVLKLDMRLVQKNVCTGKKSILDFIIELGKWMNLTITAEGTELREQVDYLKALGCDQAQGYYFARPMSEEDFTALLIKEEL